MSRRSQRRAAARARVSAVPQPTTLPVVTTRDTTIPPEVTAQITSLLRAQKRVANPDVKPFALPSFPPRAVPSKVATIAQDEAIGSTATWAAEAYGAGFAGGYGEGVQFLGFPILAELAQRPEYRKIADTWATESVRKWIAIRASGDDDKSAKVKEIEAEFDRLKVRECFRRLSEQDAFFGRSHLFLDFGAESDDELTTSVGDGTDAATRNKVSKGSLKRLKVVEALWCYPSSYCTTNPLAHDWYAPNTWYVQGKAVHATRLLTLIAREVPDLLKPMYSFGGLSMSQMARPYVDTWLKTRQAVSDLITSFSVAGIKIDLSDLLKPGGAARLAERIQFFNAARDNGGLMLLDKGGGSIPAEEFFNIQTQLGTLDKLQAQAQEQLASVSSTPLVKLLGIAPSGLNATTDGEIRVFYDSIHAYQNSFMRPSLTRVFQFAQISLWGAVDPDLSYDFIHLWSQSESELATIRKTNAETDQVLIDSSVLSPADARKRIAEDPDSPYHGLDADDLPDVEGEVDEGLEPGGEESSHSLLGRAASEAGEDGAVSKLHRLFDRSRLARDEFREQDHPRAENGQFGSGGSSEGSEPDDEDGGPAEPFDVHQDELIAPPDRDEDDGEDEDEDDEADAHDDNVQAAIDKHDADKIVLNAPLSFTDGQLDHSHVLQLLKDSIDTHRNFPSFIEDDTREHDTERAHQAAADYLKQYGDFFNEDDHDGHHLVLALDRGEEGPYWADRNAFEEGLREKGYDDEDIEYEVSGQADADREDAARAQAAVASQRRYKSTDDALNEAYPTEMREIEVAREKNDYRVVSLLRSKLIKRYKADKGVELSYDAASVKLGPAVSLRQHA